VHAVLQPFRVVRSVRLQADLANGPAKAGHYVQNESALGRSLYSPQFKDRRFVLLVESENVSVTAPQSAEQRFVAVRPLKQSVLGLTALLVFGIV
jgi:hypothetical protein